MKPNAICPSTVARRPLHRQFVQMLLLPLILAFVLAAAGTVLIGYGVELSAQKNSRQETTDIFAQSLSKPLWDCDSTTAQGIVETLAYLSMVASVQLNDICANNIVTVGSPLSGTDANTDRLQRPVLYWDELNREFTVGYLLVQFHPVSLVTAAMAVLWRYLVIFVIMLAVMLAGAALAFHKIVRLPLSRFRHAIKDRLSEAGPVATDVLSSRHGNDELGDVIRAYAELMSEQELRFRRQEILAQCASKLLTTSAASNQQVENVLGNVLEELSADCIYLAKNEYEAKDIACVTRPQDARLSATYRPRYARWQEEFSMRRRVVSTSAGFSTTERNDLRSHGVLGMAAFPVWGQDRWYGFIGVQDWHRERHWSDSEQIFLQTIADMIGAYLEGEQHTFELATVINQLRDNEKVLQQTARRDPLTGLGNRIELEDALSQAVLRAERNGQQGYVLLIDLDDFKPINDHYGHGAGDFVLQEVARRLLATVRRTDTVVRIGGDEFVIVVSEEKGAAIDSTTLIDKLSAVIAAPLVYDGQALQVGASIGAACYPADGTTSLSLLAQADQAMYAIKKKRKTTLELTSVHA